MAVGSFSPEVWRLKSVLKARNLITVGRLTHSCDPAGAVVELISEERIMGFVEGEGCFSIGFQRYVDCRSRKTGKRNNVKRPYIWKVCPSFRVVCVNNDRAILEEIKEKLGVGKIHLYKLSEKNPHYRDVAHYYVQTFSELLKVKEFFEKQRFYISKGLDFQKWCLCLEMMQRKEHLTKEGLLKICALREQMNTRLGKTTMRTIEEIKHFLAQPTLRFIHNEELARQRILFAPGNNASKNAAEKETSILLQNG